MWLPIITQSRRTSTTRVCGATGSMDFLTNILRAACTISAPPWQTGGLSSPISAAALQCARSPPAEASKARWALRRSMGCPWAPGRARISNDMRELDGSAAPGAKLAIEYFVYRIVLNAGMLAAALNGLDGFVFTAGIGENSPTIRARVAEKLAWLGVKFDAAANESGGPLISDPKSKVAVYVIGTDEELMIARHTVSLLSQKASAASG